MQFGEYKVGERFVKGLIGLIQRTRAQILSLLWLWLRTPIIPMQFVSVLCSVFTVYIYVYSALYSTSSVPL